MARTVGEVVDRCLNTWLLGTYSASYNTLKDATDGTQIEFTCGLPLGEITPGSIAAVEDELVYIYERDTTNNRFLAVRAIRGTIPARHAAGVPIEINPRFPRLLVRQAMVEEIESWPETLYVPKHFTDSLGANAGTIAIPATINNHETRHVLQVRRSSLAFGDDRQRRTFRGYESFESGNGRTISLACSWGGITTFTVVMACGFNTDPIDDFGDDVDLVEDVGLSPGMLEIVEQGAAFRLLTSRASVRLFPEAEGQSRSVAEVGAHDIPVLANAIMGLRERAIARETERLYKRYGFGGS